MSTLIQQLVNGLSTGSQYALWAVGYGVVYQVLGLMHFAYGDTVLLAMYVGFALLATSFLPIVVVLPLAMLTGALLSMLVERGVYAPLVARNERVSAFIAALGAAYVLRNVVTLVWGGQTAVYPHIFPQARVTVGPVYLDIIPLVSLAVALIVYVVFTVFLTRSKHGQAVAALAQDSWTASLMGIPVRRVITLIYGLSGIIAVAGAVLYIGNYGLLRPSDGFFITLKAFVAALIGGIGRIEGALIGGLMLGISEALLIQYVSSTFSDAIVFGLLVVILLVRPTGLMGRRELTRF